MCVRSTYQWHARCDVHLNTYFSLSYLFKHTGCVVHSKYSRKREQCGEDVVYVKTGTEPFTQNTYFAHFLEGHLSVLHSHLARIFRKPFKIIVCSTLTKSFMAGRVSPHLICFLCNVTLCDRFSVLCIKLCMYMMLFVSNALSNLIIYG